MTKTIATASRSTSSSPKPDRREFMRLTTFHWACVALALASPAMAQQSASLPSGAQPRTDVESAIPLTPGMIRDLGRRVGDNKRAEEEVNTEIASPISRRVNVSFAPGQSTSIIRIVKGYPTALSFFDRTGQPWPIEWDTNSNPAGQANNAAIAIRGLREERVLRWRAPGSTSARRRSDRTSCKSRRRRCSRAAGFSLH